MIDLFEKDADTTAVLHWSSLTPLVNEIKSPNSFITNLLFGTHETKSTEKIEMSVIVGGRESAPFVRKHGEAVMVTGYGEKFQTVEPANIRIKRVIHPAKVQNERRAGTVIFPGRGEQLGAMERYMAQQGQRLSDLATNAVEWMCAQVLRGAITYSVSPTEVFTVTFPRPTANNASVNIAWDDPDPSLPNPEMDFYNAKKIISDEVGLVPTDVILGENAGLAFMKVMKHQRLLDMLKFDVGMISLQNQFRKDGAILLGMFAGMNVWIYPRSVTVNGTAQALIRSDYAEFVCADPAAENVIYYGPIDDDDAMEGQSFVTERFSKSWKTPDPSQRFMLLHTRPLPCSRRPGSLVSMMVTGT